MRVSTINYFIVSCLLTFVGLFIIDFLSDKIYQNPGATEVQVARSKVAAASHAPNIQKSQASLQDRLAHGDITNGKKVFGNCAVCHTPFKDGPNRVGPPLFGIVGRKAAKIAKFSYSKAMRAYGETGAIWDVATLDAYLKAPRVFVPGTAMSFAGIRDDKDRADLITYLNTLKD